MRTRYAPHQDNEYCAGCGSWGHHDEVCERDISWVPEDGEAVTFTLGDGTRLIVSHADGGIYIHGDADTLTTSHVKQGASGLALFVGHAP